MEQQTIVYLAITVLSVIFAVGTFVGITRMSFKTVESTLKVLEKQIQELRDDNKAIGELSTRMSVGETRIDALEKCQDHINSDMNILKKRQIKKIED